MSKTATVLSVGFINWDSVVHTHRVPDPDCAEEITEEVHGPGGSATNTAISLASFPTLNVYLAGYVGSDEYGTNVMEHLQKHNVELAHPLMDGTTNRIIGIATNNADPRYFYRYGESEFGFDDIDSDVWEQTDHVHIESFSPQYAGEIAQKAKEDGKTVSFNPTQLYEENVFTEVVDAASIIFLNEREAELFRKRYDFESMVESKCIVITNGAAGANARHDQIAVTHTGFDAGDVKDTIGAGDSFVAGFVSEWLKTKQADVETYLAALEVANASGAYAVTQVGGFNSIDQEYVKKLLN